MPVKDGRKVIPKLKRKTGTGLHGKEETNCSCTCDPPTQESPLVWQRGFPVTSTTEIQSQKGWATSANTMNQKPLAKSTINRGKNQREARIHKQQSPPELWRALRRRCSCVQSLHESVHELIVALGACRRKWHKEKLFWHEKEFAEDVQTVFSFEPEQRFDNESLAGNKGWLHGSVVLNRNPTDLPVHVLLPARIEMPNPINDLLRRCILHQEYLALRVTHCTAGILILKRRHENDRHEAMVGMSAHRLPELQSILDRHVDIGYYNIRLRFVKSAQSILAIFRDPHFPTFIGQQMLQKQSIFRLVINNNNIHGYFAAKNEEEAGEIGLASNLSKYTFIEQ